MRRKSVNSTSDGSPAPRRTSARIAAVQAASPAKAPIKSPRRKRQSADHAKVVSEDGESQELVKSELRVEDVNGTETSSNDRDLDVVAVEVIEKKAKFDKFQTESAGIIDVGTSQELADVSTKESSRHDFEVVEQSTIPASDSEEVKAAISIQGEDGQLLVDFVQVNKDELPDSNTLEVKQIMCEPEKSSEVVNCLKDDASEKFVNNFNGDFNLGLFTEDKLNGSTVTKDSYKIPVSVDVSAQSTTAPAAGDTRLDASEIVTQE